MERSEKQTTIKHRSYTNCEITKIENRRVEVYHIEDDNYHITFKMLSDDLSPRSGHATLKGKIVVTGLNLSIDAALALLITLHAQLKKDGIII